MPRRSTITVRCVRTRRRARLLPSAADDGRGELRRSAGRAPADRLEAPGKRHGRGARFGAAHHACFPSPPRAAPGAPNAAAAARRRPLTRLWQQSLDLLEDGVELLVGLALAVAHRELRVDERRAGGHLEGARLRGRRPPYTPCNETATLPGYSWARGRRTARRAYLAPSSAASVLDADPELRHGGKGSLGSWWETRRPAGRLRARVGSAEFCTSTSGWAGREVRPRNNVL